MTLSMQGEPTVTETEVQSTEAAPVSTEGQAQTTEAPAQATETAKTYDEAYVKELREEAARYRTRAKEYDDVYGSYDDNSRTALLDIARKLADPNTQPEAAAKLRQIAEAIEANAQAGKPSKPTGEEDPDARPLTKREWEQLQAERDQRQQEEQAIRAIEREASELGYEPGSAEYFFLLEKAQLPDVAGDLKKAHDKVEQFFADKAAERARRLQDESGKFPPQTGGTGGAAPSEPVQAPTTWKEARQRAMARRTRGALGG